MAGDALVAVALAGTLFFSVPIGEARGRVALYLGLTLLPFAFLVPVAGPLLDRFRHGRRNVLAFATGGRGLMTWIMAGKVAGLGLYPLALVVLVLSRAYGVARNAALPRVKPPGVGLVSVAARVNVAGTFGTALGGTIGALVSVLIGSGAVLYLSSAVLVVAGVLAVRLPDLVDEPPPEVRSRERRRIRLRDAPRDVHPPLAATAGVRALQGLLTLFLAFWLRSENASKLELGLILGAAAFGSLLGTVGAARVPALSPTRLPYLAAGFAALVCSGAALHPSPALVAAAAGATGLAGALASVLIGSGTVLYLSSVVLVVAGVLAVRRPDLVDEPPPEVRSRERRRIRLRDAPKDVHPPLAATCGVRALQGLLTLFLAFWLRSEGASKLELGVILGSAAFGSLLGTVGAARVPALSPTRLPYLAAGFAALVCSGAALHPSTGLVAAAAGATGLAGALAKFGLDATVQGTVDAAAVSSTFARSETVLQLSWVAGAGIALLLPSNGAVGMAAAAVVVLAGLVAARKVSWP
jgi:MFS family permease